MSPSPREKRVSGVGALVFTVLALLFTGVTAWLLAMMLSGTEYTREPVQPVVVAKGPIEPLAPITEANLEVVRLPGSAVPAGTYGEIAQVVTTPPLRALVALHDGEIIFRERLADSQQGKGLALLVPPGMRALPVQLDGTAVQAHLFYPESLVDVIATVRLVKQNTVVSKTIVQGVKVLAVGTEVDPSHMAEPQGASVMAGKEEQRDSVATLLVTPEQAEQITLAQREGRVDLVLRGQKDVQSVTTTGLQPEDLFPELADVLGSPSIDAERKESARRIVSQPRFRRDDAAVTQIQVR